MKRLIYIFAFTAGLCAFAHEGHDHNAPGTVQAPKGGVIKTLEKTHVELVTKGSDLKVYLYEKDLKPKALKGFLLTATADLPRTKKPEPIVFITKDDHFEGVFDGKGAHRYTLNLTVVDPATGHRDKLNFTVEPKK